MYIRPYTKKTVFQVTQTYLGSGSDSTIQYFYSSFQRIYYFNISYFMLEKKQEQKNMPIYSFSSGYPKHTKYIKIIVRPNHLELTRIGMARKL